MAQPRSSNFGNAQRAPLAVLDSGCALHLGADQYTGQHAHPAWKLVVSRRGILRCVSSSGSGSETLTAGAILVPPHVEHRLSAEGDFLAVFVDPLRFAVAPNAQAHPEIVSLGRALKRRLEGIEEVAEQASHFESGEGALHAEVELLVRRLDLPTGGARSRVVVDTQLTLHHLEDPNADLAQLARKVGLSPSRLRHRFATEVGVPLRRYRLWCRLLRTLNAASNKTPKPGAVSTEAASQPRAIVAPSRLAADQGFSDQSHMTRVFTRLLGRTPGSLRGQFVSFCSYH